VVHAGKPVTFIDTPGHEAFTAMRARGAKVTDIAAIVVAADDGVMPQTVEAIDHAKAAGVPMVIVINKIDKPDANIEKIKQQLTEYEIVPEAWGGDTVFVEASAKKRIGLDNFLDMLLLVAEVGDLKANPDAPAGGYIIESKVDVGRGVVATMLINRGTIHIGDGVVAGEASGRVRAMHDYRGDTLVAAGPSTPVEIIGFDDVPNAGDYCHVVKNEKVARSMANKRANRVRAEALAKQSTLTLDEVFARIAQGEVLDLNLVIKADVQGSIEALADALGQIKHAEVRQVFKASKLGAIAGCMVTSGTIPRNAGIRVVRDGVVTHDGKMTSLKRFQEDTKEVQEGFECGILLDGFNDLKVGDVLEAYETREVARDG
jgi:translation initiation factor IF-2